MNLDGHILMIVELSKLELKNIDDEWSSLTQLFPEGWEDMAYKTKAVERPLRNFNSVSDLLRGLLLHSVHGYSLRETCTFLKESGIADISDTAFMERFEKSKDWFHAMNLALIKESYASPICIKKGVNLRLIDGSIVSEGGKTGSQWRLHYSFQLPSMSCDQFKITPMKGSGNGESVEHYDIKENDHIIADRGYSRTKTVQEIDAAGASCLIRVNTQSLPLFDKEGKKLDLLNMFDSSLTEPGASREWKVFVKTDSGALIPGRLGVVKKSKAAAEKAKKKLIQKSRDHKEVKESTIRFAEFVILFTTFTEELFSLEEILDLYRWRWQIELAFKRLKSLINLGHLPKHNENSSQAWLYGKLFISLVIERLTQSLERLFFPWGNTKVKSTG